MASGVTHFDTLEAWLENLTRADNDAPTDATQPGQVLCRQCHAHITNNCALIPIGGETCHFFTNPLGIGFDIHTYQQAPGCVVSGKPIEHFTWFEGFCWQYAYCKQCNQHLGWYYHCDGAAGFYGLITDRLILSRN